MSTNQTGVFGDITLDRKIVAALTEMGFEEPSPIQTQTIPLVLSGVDVIGQAQTGTGKTAAFGIPIIQNLIDTRKIQALIMTPTRELAIQVAEELGKIGRLRRVKVLPVYGGQPIERQIRALRLGVQIVIGTPGRLLDHIRRDTIKIDSIRHLVLDEADEMLDMGFIDDIESIIKNTPEDRQTLLFSATMPKPIVRLAEKYMHKPQLVTVSKEELTVPLIDQFYYETNDKLDGLCRVLDVENTVKTIIFCRTKKGVDELAVALGNRGYLAEALHGDLSQNQRDRVMKKFREGRSDILIATDVAARGLDIDNITHSINYDIPQDPESYVHRIGRTGRAGNKGTALTFITSREFRQLKIIEKVINTRITRKNLPTAVNVLERQRETILSRMFAVLEQGKLENYKPILEELLDSYAAEDIAAAALKLMQEGAKALVPEDKPSFAGTGARGGMVRLFMNVGRQQKIAPEDIVRTIASEADIPGSVIGLINIYDKFTFVEIPENMAEKVINVMHRGNIKGYKVNVELARGRD
ncbi:MAG: DEAD/DEAH box helicase [Acidaminococcales bacterium]|jgi:ATP-dependent RNA helicase DeaD|nr:DEAD/DEAH box helicase [Acidaminococcales bacterium]